MSIQTTLHEGVLTIKIARAQKKNALTLEMYAAMADALVAAQADVTVCAVVITGEPGVFTAGNDIEDFLNSPPSEGAERDQWPVLQFMRALIAIDKPVVAAVTGVAVGIGTTMLLHCDLVYVSNEARFAMPFVGLGIVPEFASSILAPQIMGRVRAAEKILLGDPFTAAEAVECGIANAALAADKVVDHATNVARRFNSLPRGAVRDSKRLLRQSTKPEVVMEALERELDLLVRRLDGPEAKEAFSAFLQKRKPDFSQFVSVDGQSR
jgi:enoyl-CoA hydratase/carnithine racemase